jgi:hypothetical protein
MYAIHSGLSLFAQVGCHKLEIIMPRINVSRDTYERLQAFLALGDQLQGEPMTIELCAEALIFMGMRSILDGLYRQLDPDTLIETLQKLAEAHPQQVYPFMATVLKTGNQIAQEQEREIPPFGFRPPSPAD